MDRRRFLRLSASAAAPVVLGRGLAGQQPAAPIDPVVVIGGGLAGLHAAALVRAAGRPVVVLEGQPSAGGRVRTVRDRFGDGLYGEAGPIRIASSHARVLGLAAEHRLNVIPFDSGNGDELVAIGGARVRASAIGQSRIARALKPDERGLTQGALLAKYVGAIPDGLRDPAPPPASYAGWAAYDRATWPDWLRSRGASEAAVGLMTIGGDSRELSALYVLRQYALLRGGSPFFKIEGGMDRLPRAMAAALGDAVRYGARVTAIDQTSVPLQVAYLERGIPRRIAASRAIVTLPFSMLGAVDVRPAFSPPKARAIAELPYFPAARLLFKTRTRFWHKAGLSGYVRTDQPAEIWDGTYEVPAAAGVLGATVGGALGRRLAGPDLRNAADLAVKLMTAVFPGFRDQARDTDIWPWATDPWARGAFAVFHPGQMASMMPSIAAPEGRLHFAGEHTSPWMGWMEGALESAERAAREVLSS